MAIDPTSTYIHLAADGEGRTVPGGDAFWSLPANEIERFGHGWLVAEFTFDADWPNWEMHPQADELVYLLEGAADLLLERPEGIEHVTLAGRGAVLVPRGVWHTAKVHAPARMLHVTMGAGTQHRAVRAA